MATLKELWKFRTTPTIKVTIGGWPKGCWFEVVAERNDTFIGFHEAGHPGHYTNTTVSTWILYQEPEELVTYYKIITKNLGGYFLGCELFENEDEAKGLYCGEFVRLATEIPIKLPRLK